MDRINLVKKFVETGVMVQSNNCNGDPVQYEYSEPGVKTTVLIVWDATRQGWQLQTKRGKYDLVKHETQNYWVPVNSPVKMHVILRPMGGEVIFWVKQQAEKSGLNLLKEAANG